MADISTWTYAGDAGGGNAHGAYYYGSAWESGTNTGGNYSTVSWSISATYFCKSGYTWGGTSRPNAGYLDMIINDSVVGTMTLPINNGWGNGQDIGSKSGSLTIYHNSDGSGSFKFHIRIRSGTDQLGRDVVYNPWETGDVWKNLTTIPRASEPSASTNSPTAGVAFTVYTNRKSTNFTHAFWYKIFYSGSEGGWVKFASDVTDSTSVTVPESVFDSAGSSSSLTCRIACDTYNGSTNIGEKTIDLTLYANEDMKPTISSVSVNETNSSVRSKGNVTLRYLSRKTVTCKISTKNGASVSSVTVANGNSSVNMSNSNGTWTSSSMENLQTGTYLITATDSRGLKATYQIFQTYYEYAYPSITGSADRSSSTGSNGTLKINGTYWNGLSNTASITYRRSTESSTHTLSATPSSGKVSGSVSYSDLDYQTAYSWDVTITDGFGETVRGSIGLPASVPALFIGKSFVQVNKLYINGKTLLDMTYPVGAIYTSTSSTSPATLFGGSWTEITGRFLLARDSSHPAGSTGGEYNHTLTVNEMPAHSHTYENCFWGYPKADYRTEMDAYKTPLRSNDGYVHPQYKLPTPSAGGGAQHNNTPPYLSVYMWRRTA